MLHHGRVVLQGHVLVLLLDDLALKLHHGDELGHVFEVHGLGDLALELELLQRDFVKERLDGSGLQLEVGDGVVDLGLGQALLDYVVQADGELFSLTLCLAAKLAASELLELFAFVVWLPQGHLKNRRDALD